ncbi:hypothetical protein [Bacillus sp. J37]|uniref:hypothetical protein n=1 Tax=Bacillus sp. J37 TaxID=935837 RepID=UPI00047D2EA8|nr:hypothetical protein [Bacillus sp. J37]
MDLQTIISTVNTLADEEFPPEQITTWINDAIARINVQLNANFPFLSVTKPSESPVFPEVYHYLLLVPFATARIKQMDSSQFEYVDLFREFEENLVTFQAKYKVPEEYRTEDNFTVYEIQVVDGITTL